MHRHVYCVRAREAGSLNSNTTRTRVCSTVWSAVRRRVGEPGFMVRPADHTAFFLRVVGVAPLPRYLRTGPGTVVNWHAGGGAGVGPWALGCLVPVPILK